MSHLERLYRLRVPFPLAVEEISPSAIVLPSDHFLCLSGLPDSTDPIAPPDKSNQDEGGRIDISTLAAADYDVSVFTGFLPPEEPIRRLSEEDSIEWAALESLLESGQREIIAGGGVGRVGQSWQDAVEALGILPIGLLKSLPLLRRAHVALSFVGHMYIHSSWPASRSVPSAIAIPWTKVSDRLGLPPILTYADTVLWNWKLVDSTQGITASNVEINTTFTSSSSEHAFFLLSLLCELHAPPILRSMASTLDESFFSDALALPRIASHLTLIANLIDQLTDLLAQAMKGSFGVNGQSNIIPEVFYWDIRPWFNGGKWRYEGVDAVGREAEWGGPSAGQSSLIHAVDLFLGIDHSPRPSATPSPPTITPPSLSIPTATPALPSTPQKILPKPALSSSFMEKASLYMPSHHRAFLHHLSSLSLFSPRTNPHPLPSIRSLAIKHPKDVGIAFDDAVRSMKRFRDEHMKIATRFIVSQARKEPDRSSVFWVEWEEKRMAKELLTTSPPVSPIGSSSDGEEGGEGKLKGTGGTELVTFLKGCRVRTIEALVGSPSSS